MVNRREDILREAARLFRENGYERTSVREIAEAVDMQSGSLFYHFKSKEDILVEIMGMGIDGLISRLNAALAGVDSPRERLLAWLTVHLAAMLEDFPDAMRVYLYEWRSLSPDARAVLIAQRDSYEARVSALLDELAAAGLVRGDIKLFRLFLLGAVNWTAQWYNPQGGLSARAIAEQYLNIVLPEPSTT
jgi:AcrR family transcriptional regulator